MNEQISDLVGKTFAHCDGNDSCSRAVLKVMMEYYGDTNEIWHKIAGPFGDRSKCSMRAANLIDS